jgi:hypothetical protein
MNVTDIAIPALEIAIPTVALVGLLASALDDAMALYDRIGA